MPLTPNGDAGILLGLGDSIMHAASKGQMHDEYYMAQLAEQLALLGCDIDLSVWGFSGADTTDLVKLSEAMWACVDTTNVKAFVLEMGVNDVISGHVVASSVTKNNLKTVLKQAAYYGIKKLFVLNTVFLNYSAGDASVRDTTSVPYTLHVAIRQAQLDATTEALSELQAEDTANGTTYSSGLTIRYSDWYGRHSALITAGVVDSAGAHLLQAADNDEHPNAAGNTQIGLFLAEEFQASVAGSAYLEFIPAERS